MSQTEKDIMNEWSTKWFQFILDNPDKPWDWYSLSANPNITWDIVQQNPNKPWDYESLSMNPNITLDIIRQTPNKKWSWGYLSRNPNITWDIVKQNPYKPWDYESLSMNPNITWDIIQQTPNKKWSWRYLSSNPNITWDIIQQNPNKKWGWFDLSSNPNIICIWDNGQQNLDKEFSWSRLSFNPNITWDIVQQNPDKPWDYESLSSNPNITWDIVQQNPDKPWDWEMLSSNPNITWDIVQKNPNEPCNLSWDVVEKNLDKPWDWSELSSNPNITWDIVQKNPDKPWDWEMLSSNTMEKARKQFINEKLNAESNHVSSQHIQSASYYLNTESEQTSEMSRIPKTKTQKVSIIDNKVPSKKESEVEFAPLIPVDNINLCIVGGVSTGKSTILNAIFCEELTQCKIKRTTMVPTIYVENDNNKPNLDNPATIFDTIAKKNAEIIEKTETSTTVDEKEYAELVFNVGKLDINILPDSYVNVYDIPGLNDARTKSIYYKYLERNFFRFNLVVFIVDIHSGLNTSDEADILRFIADHTKFQLISNNKKIYTLVVVNKADDMQLLDSADDKLEVIGELGEMFDQVQNTVTEEFKTRDIADLLVGIIPLCAIDSYLYRMTEKHGDKFKLSEEQILKIGISELGKKVFSKLAKKTQETRVREILNDKEFVDTMIKLSGFRHFEKLLHSFLAQNDTGKQIRIDNLLYELRKYAPLQEFTAKHLQDLNSVTKLCDQYFKIFRAIEKIDTDIGSELISAASHDIIDTIRKYIHTELSSTVQISKVKSIIAYYDTFREKILTPYFGVEEMYPKFICDLTIDKLVDILHTYQLTSNKINKAIDICEKMDILNADTFRKLNAAIVENTNRFSAFIHDISNIKQENEEYLQYIKLGRELGVEMTIFLRFVILSRLCYKSYYSEKQLFQKWMIYQASDSVEIPVYTYLQNITSRISNPSPEWFLYDVNDHITEQEAHQLDVYYLKNLV